MSARLERAGEFVDACEAALDAAGVAGVTVTTNGLKVPAASRIRNGGGVVIRPPSLTFSTWGADPEAEWTVVLVSGPANDPVAAWARLDDMIAALAPALAVTRAEPDSWLPRDSKEQSLPAYVLTIND